MSDPLRLRVLVELEANGSVARVDPDPPPLGQPAGWHETTTLEVVNNTPQRMSTIRISEIENSDWDHYRPDHNFNNVSIGARDSRAEPEDVNLSNATAWFRMTITFENGDEITFRADQREATSHSISTREFPIGGPSGSQYLVLQRVGKDWNTFAVSVRVSLPDWMGRLRGMPALSALTIPGTHESCARHGGPMAECQTKSLTEQLDGGVRFLDIRCRHLNNAFTIHHGIVYQNLNFTDVRDYCTGWLQQHPTETILMSVKHEYPKGDAGNTETFAETFERYVTGYEGFWFLDNRAPTLVEARRKIVLLRRFTPGGVARGIDWHAGWVDDATFTMSTGAGTFQVQDKYKVPTLFDVDRKKQDVKSQLDAAVAGRPEDWYVNFTSGWGGGAYPNAIADRVNPYLLDEVLGRAGPTRLGIVPMDFPENPSDLLLRKLVSLNDLA